MRSPRSLRLNGIERGSANSTYARRAHNAAYAERRISGDPSPTREDLAVTRRLVSAGEILGIDVLDHIVIGDEGWVSLHGAKLIP
jgi:DNA repair protein RadC